MSDVVGDAMLMSLMFGSNLERHELIMKARTQVEREGGEIGGTPEVIGLYDAVYTSRYKNGGQQNG